MHTDNPRIPKIKLIKKQTTFSKMPIYECLVFPKLDKIEKMHVVGRLVFDAHVKKLYFDKDHMMVTHKKGDGRNNGVGNLLEVTRSAILKKAYSLSHHKSPFRINTEKN